jgi:cytochrome c5
LVGRRRRASTVSTHTTSSAGTSLFKRLCTQAHAAGLLCAPSVGPGFDARLATPQEAVWPRLNGLTYDRMWKTAIKSKPDLATVTSYNERR